MGGAAMAGAVPGRWPPLPWVRGPLRIRTVLPTGSWYGYSALLFCPAVLPCRLPGRLPGPLAWPSRLVLWAGPLVWSSGLAFLAQAPACGRRHSCWAWVPVGFIPAAGGALDRNILAIYSEYTMNLQSVARRSRALRAAAPDPAPHAGTSALASELRLGAGVSLAQGLR